MTKEERREKWLKEHPKFEFERKCENLHYPKKCVVCTAEFVPISGIQKYCKKLCYNKDRFIRHRKKQYVRWKVHHAVKIGILKRSLTCEHCNQIKNTEGHHSDYSKPLEVIWLCRQCHSKIPK